MINVQASVTIDRPIEEVFGFASDLGNVARWASGIAESNVPIEPRNNRRNRNSYCSGNRLDRGSSGLVPLEPTACCGLRS